MNLEEDIYLPVSKEFLIQMGNLSKTAIKIYLSLSFHRAKTIDKKRQSKKISVSHREIRINEFSPDVYRSEWFGVCNDERAYYRAVKELEEKKLITIIRIHAENGKPLPNVYHFK